MLVTIDQNNKDKGKDWRVSLCSQESARVHGRRRIADPIKTDMKMVFPSPTQFM